MADELNRVEAHRQIGQTAVEQLCISAIDDGLGMTQQDLLFMERLQQLIDENMRDEAFSINEVAERVGFSSSSYFAKCFRQKYGVLPKDYADQKSSSSVSAEPSTD